VSDPLYIGLGLRPLSHEPARIDFIWRDDHLAWVLSDISDLESLVEAVVSEVRSRGDQVELIYMTNTGLDFVIYRRVKDELWRLAGDAIKVRPLFQRRGWPQRTRVGQVNREQEQDNVASLHREHG
jgi:hypothetical protein